MKFALLQNILAGHLGRNPLIVRDQDQGQSKFAVQPLQQITHFLPCLLIQISRGFVGQQNPGLVGNGPGNGQTLLLSA